MIVNKYRKDDIRSIDLHAKNRLEKFKLRYEMYNDNYREQIIWKLGEIYRAFSQLKLDVQINDNYNIYKQVVNAISNVYSFGVDREFDNDAIGELYNKLRINKTMAQANRYLNAFNDLLIQVSWDDKKQQPKIMLRLPHNTEVEWEQNEVKSVKYFVEMTDDNEELWAYWSDEEHYYVLRGKEADKKIAIKDNEEMVNPFGTLPFVFMHNGWRDENFWDMFTGDDLTGGTIDMAVHLTFLNHLIKTQSFKQLVGKGDNVGELLGQVLDPLSVLTLTGQNTEIDVLDLQANYEQLHKVAQDLANNIAVNYGISPSQFRMTGSVSSGFALQMENMKLDRFTVEQQQDFKVYEQELFGMIKMVSDYYGSSLGDGDMFVDFVEPNYPTSEAEQLTIDQTKIDMGLTKTVDIMIKRNPDLTEEEAKALVAENLNARNDMLNKTANISITTDIPEKL